MHARRRHTQSSPGSGAPDAARTAEGDGPSCELTSRAGHAGEHDQLLRKRVLQTGPPSSPPQEPWASQKPVPVLTRLAEQRVVERTCSPSQRSGVHGPCSHSGAEEELPGPASLPQAPASASWAQGNASSAEARPGAAPGGLEGWTRWTELPRARPAPNTGFPRASGQGQLGPPSPQAGLGALLPPPTPSPMERPLHGWAGVRSPVE